MDSVQPDRKWVLALNPDIGAIYRCGNCRNIHVQIGSMDFQLSPDAYYALVDMVSRSAANFEMLLEAEGRAA